MTDRNLDKTTVAVPMCGVSWGDRAEFAQNELPGDWRVICRLGEANASYKVDIVWRSRHTSPDLQAQKIFSK